MAVSVIECLLGAEHNLKQGIPAIRGIAMSQLRNGLGLLEKGYGVDDEVEPLLEKYGSLEAVPHKDECGEV